MVVLVSLTTKNKPFPVRSNSLGLETDAKLGKVTDKLVFIQCAGFKSTYCMAAIVRAL